MPSSVVRKGIWAVVAAAMAVVLIVATLPLIASTRIVRDRIAYEMSAWSGFRVTMEAAPHIEVWPSFRAVLSDVTLFEWGNADRGPVIRAERAELDLSAVAANPTAPDTASLPSGAFGRVEFSDGRIEVSYPDGDSETATDVAGSLSWPEFNRAATLSATGTWRGEKVALDASSEKPLMLLAGGNAPLTFDLKAKPLVASFSGTANLSASHFVDGTVELSSPSLRRALEWSQMEISPGAAIGEVSLVARVTGSGNRYKFADTRITLGGKAGMGGLELAFADSVPSISGTLAFESIDLTSFLSAFAMLPSGKETADAIDTSFIDQVKLDLRLSATNATAGTLGLTDVAATAQVKGGLVAFDISDATAFSGSLQAGLRLDRNIEGTHGEFRLLASEVDSGALAAAAGLKRLAPKGPGTISVLLKGEMEDWRSMLDRAEGTISAKFGPGTISGLDLAAFLERCKEGGFFPLSDVAKGTLPIESAEFKAALSNGTARIEKAQATSGPRTISISGIIPYIGRGLALSGTVSSGTSEEAANSGVAFFVGGAWGSPFVSPIITGSRAQEW